MAHGFKSGGRTKGTKNKGTKEMRVLIANFLGAKLDDIDTLYDELSPDKKTLFILKLLPFAIPRLTDEIVVEQPQTQDWSKLDKDELLQMIALLKKVEI